MKMTIFLFAIIVLSAVSFAAAPDLFPTLTTASKSANIYSVYVIVKNIGSMESGPYTVDVNYGDGVSDRKNITKQIGVGKVASHQFDHRYPKSGVYMIKSTTTAKNDNNVFNNKAERKFNVIVRSTTPTGKITEKSMLETFLSRLMEMLG